MARGPHIQQSEVDRAHQLRAAGKNNAAIARELKRSAPCVGKMLAMQPTVNKSDEPQTA